MDNRDRFDKFTERARTVLSLAQEEAQRFNHHYIGTEHLLLGLVREGDGVAANVLSNLGVHLASVRAEVERVIGRGDHIVQGDLGLTPRAKKVVELAVDEARRLGHHSIGTEHLLLGLVREGEGIAAGVLQSLGVTLEGLRQTTIQVLSPSASADAAPGTPPPAGVQTTPLGGQPPQPHSAPFPAPDQQARFDRFTERARRTLSLAQEEAQRLNHNYIGTEHLLLGLVRVEDSVAAKVLANLGVELTKVRSTVEFISGRGDRIVLGDIGLTPRAKKVLELSVDEARRLGHHSIGTEHLVLGLIREGEGIAAGVLQSLGVTLERVHAETLRVLGDQGSAPEV
jgi:ATP-dependent Clp protease ATP-binding subunit ClpA